VRYVFAAACLLLFVSILGCISYHKPEPVEVPKQRELTLTLTPSVSTRSLPASAYVSEAPSPEPLIVRSAIAQWPGAERLARAERSFTLQRRLREFGCYSGPIDGQWNETTKRAMSKLLLQANAKLPVNEPDAALLSLANSGLHTCRPGPCAGSSGCIRQTVTTGATLASTPAQGSKAELPLVAETKNTIGDRKMSLGGPMDTVAKTRAPPRLSENREWQFRHPLGSF
jgi:hypothetical protein